ncbi:hypothetical protein CLOM_g23922 [Closterium sp. NIES-68]|nr:hypothetical protein CLOM_g23922 [Closterium sp. NIES-68]GJP86243.1 hypothetical protein CLOP_g16288 [Closterium sp. NIES-67]
MAGRDDFGGQEVEVLLVTPGSQACELVRVSARREETAAGLAQQVLRDQGIALGEGGAASLVFNGVELDERSTLDQCGIRCASGRESWAPRFLFPNAWHMQSVPRKPPVKVTNPTWPVARHGAPPQPLPSSVLSLLTLPFDSVPVWALFLCLFIAGLFAPL